MLKSGMRAKLLLISFLSMLLLPLSPLGSQEPPQSDDGTWYPFVLSEQLDPNSPANMGKQVLDAPAGKHGFVTVKGSNFVFEDATPARFWGTNLCFSACFPSKEQAEKMADRLAFFGFNAVRLHHMDFFFEPQGIFKDTYPGAENPQDKKTGILSPEQLDKLDYLVYQFKIRGIYVDMNLLVARRFTEADGVKDAGKLGIAAKPVSYFDARLIELQKQYARDLLTHVNPYTKLRYADDPAVALVEITNENSIFDFWKWNRLNGPLAGFKKDSIPDYYVKELDTLWNIWLKNKYKTPQGVIAAWHFNAPAETPVPVETPLKDGSLELLGGAQARQMDTSDGTQITIKKITGTDWHIQWMYAPLPVAANKNYILTFTAKAKRKTSIGVMCQRSESPWDILGLSESVPLEKKFTTFEVPFTATSDCPNAKIAFVLGGTATTVTLKDIRLRESHGIPLTGQESADGFNFGRPLYKLRHFYPRQRIEDIESFYTDLERSYFDTMLSTLKKDIGVRCPITGIGGYPVPQDVLAQENCDFIDTHTYWDHPYFPQGGWDRDHFKIGGKSLLSDPKLGYIERMRQKKEGHTKPQTMTEWSHCYPNRYAYEAPVLTAVTARENNWNGLFKFAFSHSAPDSNKWNQIDSYFDVIANPQQLLLLSVASNVYLTRDPVNSDDIPPSFEKRGGDLPAGRQGDFDKSPSIPLSQRGKSARGALRSSVEDGVFTLNSDFVEGCAGKIAGKTIALAHAELKADDNGAIYLFARGPEPIAGSQDLVLILAGDVSNDASGWNAEGWFCWGVTPTWLSRLNAELSISSKQPLKAYPLDDHGKPGQELKTSFAGGKTRLILKDVQTPWILLTSRKKSD